MLGHSHRHGRLSVAINLLAVFGSAEQNLHQPADPKSYTTANGLL